MWLLANPGKDQLDLLVMEFYQDQGEGGDQTSGPATVKHPFSIVRPETSGGGGMTSEPGTTPRTTTVSMTAVAAKIENMSISHHDDARVPPGQVHTPDRRGREIIQAGQVSFLLFSFNILSNHISKTTTGTAVNISRSPVRYLLA